MNQRTQAGHRALARLCQHDLLSIDEERRLFGRLKILKAKGLRYRRSADDKVASKEAVAIRNRIVESNLRLVVSLARHYAAPERSLEELVSEASLPLIRCVESFDSRRGTRFSTYATRALTNFFARLRRQDYRRRTRFPFGDDRVSVTWTEGRSIGSDSLIQAEECHRLAKQLARLSSRERALVTDRFGLTGDRRPLTFRELGARHGLSKERVRVITCEAIARLRESFDESRRREDRHVCVPLADSCSGGRCLPVARPSGGVSSAHSAVGRHSPRRRGERRGRGVAGGDRDCSRPFPPTMDRRASRHRARKTVSRHSNPRAVCPLGAYAYNQPRRGGRQLAGRSNRVCASVRRCLDGRSDYRGFTASCGRRLIIDIERRSATSLAHRRSAQARPMKILVTGCNGLVGNALVPFLTTGGHSVTRLVRRATSDEAGRDSIVRWDPDPGND